jgi:hypothetical protein
MSFSNKYLARNREMRRNFRDYKASLLVTGNSFHVQRHNFDLVWQRTNITPPDGEHQADLLVRHKLVTILIEKNGPALGRISRAYVSLALMPENSDRSRVITLERYGAYEVRLVEFSQKDPTKDSIFWLELYCHVTNSSLDSCSCDDLDDAEIAADYLISSAKQLHDKHD